MVRYLFITVAVFLPGIVGVAGVFAAAIGPDELLARAKESRRKAESDLADARKRHLQERKALAARLHLEYDALETAKAEAKRAQQSLRRLQAVSVDLERTTAAAVHRIRGMIRQAAGAAGATVDPADSIESMERAIWNGFQERLARIEADLEVVVRRERIIGRDGNERDVPVVRLGGVAAFACGDVRDTCGLLRTLTDGKQLVVGPYLDEAQAAALRAAAAGNLSHVPFDVDGALAGRTPAEPKSVKTWLDAGGMFVYPILLVGALGLILILERVGYLIVTKTPPSLIRRVLPCLERRDVEGAREVLRSSGTPAGRVLLAGVLAIGKTDEQREAAMESALLAEAPKLERSLSLLGALAGVAPLLGLLGTVSGMITTFDTISAAGTGNPRLLSGGISEALITTQLGLMVAIPLLLAHAWLRRWVERREAMLEHNAIQIFGIREKGQDEPA